MEGEGQLQTKGGLLDLLDEFCFPVSPFWVGWNNNIQLVIVSQLCYLLYLNKKARSR